MLGWESVYAWNDETFGPDGTLGRTDTKEAVLTRDLRAALERLNPDLPAPAIEDALRALTRPRLQPLDGAAQPGLLPPDPRRRAGHLPRRRRAVRETPAPA